MSLTKEHILNHLRNTYPLNEIPFRPEGGETFLFQGGPSKLQDWRADGHQWINQGTVGLPRSNPKLTKEQFDIHTENGASKEFSAYHEPDNTDGPFLIQYCCNDDISQPLPHGN